MALGNFVNVVILRNAIFHFQLFYIFDCVQKVKFNEYNNKYLPYENNSFFSKNFLKDLKKLYSGEPLVKEFPAGTSLTEIADSVDKGETASVDGKLYVNDNGKMIELKMSKETFAKLFPIKPLQTEPELHFLLKLYDMRIYKIYEKAKFRIISGFY